MDCKFVNGQRVVFSGPFSDMDAAIFKAFNTKNFKLPKSGTVYSVRRIFVSVSGQVCIHVMEINNRDLRHPGSEPGFPAKYFKPVDETRLDVFRSLLTPVKRKELV